MRLAPPQTTEPDDAELATLAALRARLRLTCAQTASILWMEAADVRRWDGDEAAPVQPETLLRLALADDVGLAAAGHLRGWDLVPHWLRMPNAALGASPLEALTGPTATVRQLRWRLRSELADRRTAGAGA